MKKRFRKTVSLAAALFLAAACFLPAGMTAAAADRTDAAWQEDTAEEGWYMLPVFETSDTHGWLAAESGGEYLYRLAYISDKVKDVRGYGGTARKDRAVLLDGGDIYQGNTMSNLLEGDSLSAAYMIMGYDAVTIGNHEFDWMIGNTVDADGTMKDYDMGDGSGVNDIPVVISNLYQNVEKPGFAEDYIILNKTAVDAEGREMPVKIAVIGFAGSYGSSIKYDHFTGLGYSIRPDYDGVNALAVSLEESGQCDATILLAHEDAYIIAGGIGEGSAVDLILGGHTHKSQKGRTADGLWYLEPACYGNAFIYAELAFEEENGRPVFTGVVNPKTVEVSSDPSRLTDTPENASELDPEIVGLTNTVIGLLSKVLEEEVGYITESAVRYSYLEGSGEHASTCGNWMASIYAEIADADIGFVNNGALRMDLKVDKDTCRRVITVSDIYNMFPFDNQVYCYELTWEDMLSLLELSLTETGRTFLSDMTGAYCYYTDETVNAIVTADGQTVYADGVWMNGWKDRTVRVGVSEYMTTKRLANGLTNLFIEWTDSPRFLGECGMEKEGAVNVLMQEAEENSGHLTVDKTAYYINGEYDEEEVKCLFLQDLWYHIRRLLFPQWEKAVKTR